MSDVAASYDEIPYDCKPQYATHPDCLATLATLMGMKPAPVDGCRVLELGCATGGNLIPMAISLPGSRFVGIDLSPAQIATGQQIIAALGLKNIELKPLSILDVDDGFGQFDYISCHGVYSWVPPEVQDKILTICKRNLAPQGVAYVSYNTYPGWHQRALVREMLGFHVRRFPEARLRVQQARAFLDFLVESVPDPNSTYARVLREEADMLRPAADSYLFHEHLEDANNPVYFYEFANRIAAKGLQYLGESWFHTRLDNLPAAVQETLQQLSENLIQLEQYLDFVRNRTFRRTLVCHADVHLDRELRPEALSAFYLRALAQPLSSRPDVCSDAVEQFRLDNGTTASTNNPLVKAALVVLYDVWPQVLVYDEVADRVQNLLKKQSGASPSVHEQLAEAVLRCYLANLVALHVHPMQFVVKPGRRPIASPLARFQAATTAVVTSLNHRRVLLDDLDRSVLPLLDGSRDQQDLIDALVARVASGELELQKAGQPVRDQKSIREMLAEIMPACLGGLGRRALLLA